MYAFIQNVLGALRKPV